jgi:hypothetical protein
MRTVRLFTVLCVLIFPVPLQRRCGTARKAETGFCACAITFQKQPTLTVGVELWRNDNEREMKVDGSQCRVILIICPSVILSAVIPTCIALGSKPNLRGDRRPLHELKIC